MLTYERLRELMEYDPETGIFTRRITTNNASQAGTVPKPLRRSDRNDRFGYRRITVAKKQYNYARVVWLYVHGEWPDLEIDHINGDASDNRIANLRLVSRTENMQARVEYRRSKTGYRGVSKNPAGRYQAQISVGGKKRHIGIFDTPEEAYEAWCAAAIVLRGKFACLV